MRLATLLVLAVTLTGCGLIDAAGDPDPDDGAGDDGDGSDPGPHRMTFSPPVRITDACGLDDELDESVFIVDIDASGALTRDIDDATGTFIAAVIFGQLDSDGGEGGIDCDPDDSDLPFLDWTVTGSPSEGFSGTYHHDMDGDGTLTIVAE